MIQLQVGVKILLKNKENKYLLIRRSKEKYQNVKGEWDIVGGRIDPGSKLLDNLKREVYEETKLNILNEPTLICAQDIIPNEERHIVRLTYTGEVEGEIELDLSENVEYKWLTFDELSKQENLDIYFEEIVDKGLIK